MPGNMQIDRWCWERCEEITRFVIYANWAVKYGVRNKMRLILDGMVVSATISTSFLVTAEGAAGVRKRPSKWLVGKAARIPNFGKT